MPLSLPILLTLLPLSTAAAAAPLLPLCGTIPQPAPPRQPPPPGDTLRDFYDVPSSQTSAHFVLRWGSSGAPSSTEVDTILEALEFSYGVLVETLEMPPPLGSDTYLFNVYMGDTGDGTPSSSGAAGYYTFDRAGWPMIVLSPYVTDDLTYGRSVIAHELFHALQSATGNYEYTATSPSSWFWEASAEWAAGEVYTDDPYYAQFISAFAFYPHYPLDYFNYPDEGLFIETYQYGAFIFPRYLSEVLGRPELVRDAWTDPGSAADPISAIAANLAAEGVDFLPLVADFYAHNAWWDYEDGDLYASVIDGYGAWYDDEDFQIAEWEDVGDGRADDWQQISNSLLPGRLGASRVVFSARDACGTLSLAFDGEGTGSSGSAAVWAGVLALHSSSGEAYLPLEDEQTLSVELDGSTTSISLVVVPASTARVPEEVFDYAYAWSFAPVTDRDAAGCTAVSGGGGPGGSSSGAGGGLTAPPDGCGCGATSSSGGLSLVVILLGGGWQRRRRRRQAEAPCST